jgi:hypothetical protein
MQDHQIETSTYSCAMLGARAVTPGGYSGSG